MTKFEDLGGGVIKITAPGKLRSGDFLDISPKVEAVLKAHAAVRLLLNVTHLEGWESLTALEQYASFVKAHQDKVERIAVLARREWQHWLVGAVRVFVHPQVEMFDSGNEADALRWLRATGAPQAGKPVPALPGSL